MLSRRKMIEPETDMTPMVDVTFLLLIFFMVSMSVAFASKLDVPPAEYEGGGSFPVSPGPTSVEIYIGPDNTISVDGQATATFSELVRTLETQLSETGLDRVCIETAPESLHQQTIMALDAARAARVPVIQYRSNTWVKTTS